MSEAKSNWISSKSTLIVFLVALSILFAISVYDLTKILIESNAKSTPLSYTNSSTIDYNVYLKQNDFIGESILPAGKTYITELVDKINMTMKYEYNSSLSIPISYQHKIIATIYGLYNEDPNSDDNPIIWEKETVIKDLKETVTKSNNNFIVTENFDLNMTEFNEEIAKFVNRFDIPTAAYLEVKMPVIINGSNKKYLINENYIVIARIPLIDKVMSVEAETNKSETKNAKTLIEETFKIEPGKTIVYSLVIIISGALITISIIKLTKSNSKSSYNVELQKLKNDYNELIVATNNMVDIKKFIPVSIVSFEEMRNLSNCLTMPIILYEKKEVACFYIVKDNIIYVYIMKEKKKNTNAE